MTIRICAKCSDLFSARTFIDGECRTYNGYVPNWFPNPSTEHYGDYVQLDIDVDTGKIIGWRKPTLKQLRETFKS